MSFTAAQARDAMEHFPIVPLAGLLRRGLPVVAPHPDDESLGCGGLIAACRAASVPVRIVAVSDGAGSHPASRAFPPARLAALRRSEMLAAADQLGVAASDVDFIDLPDRAVPEAGPEAARAVEAIVAAAAGADAIAVTWHHDPHCDHKASVALARAAAVRLPGVRLWEYPIWGLALPDDTVLEGALPQGVRVDVGAHLGAKRRAVYAHASQCSALIADDPAGFRLQPAMLARFTGRYEILIEANS
ncbi:MAG TPA: PIG-L family deacetylase [Xanthobacteraceae bacterium]|nr:PIG-L family deacetylase [Xanthobacteraceae bacterium]